MLHGGPNYLRDFSAEIGALQTPARAGDIVTFTIFMTVADDKFPGTCALEVT
jgi:hypothetical protein